MTLTSKQDFAYHQGWASVHHRVAVDYAHELQHLNCLEEHFRPCIVGVFLSPYVDRSVTPPVVKFRPVQL